MPQDFDRARREYKLKTGGIIYEIVSVNGSQYSSTGNLYVRMPGGFDTGTSVKNPVIEVRPKYGSFNDSVGRKVWVGKGYDNKLEVKDNVASDLQQRNIDARQFNPNNRSARYRPIEHLLNLQSFPTGGDGTVKVMPGIYRKPDGTYGIFSGQGSIDLLSSYTPGTSTNQLIVCLWLDPNTNTISITASSELSQSVNLKQTPTSALNYINECVLTAPAQSIGVWAWIIRGDDTVISEDNKFHDLRGIIGAGSSGASASYPQPVASTFAIPSGNNIIVMDDWSISATGSVSIPASSAVRMIR